MVMKLSARTVHAVLRAVQEISGPQYDHLLERAGWTRFQSAIPLESADLVATQAELESLFANVYTLLGEGLTRLFLRNYGRLLAAQIFTMAEGSGVREAAAAIPLEQQLAWFAMVLVRMSTRDWTPATLAEDAQAYYLTFERCPLCAGVRDAQAPLCATLEA